MGILRSDRVSGLGGANAFNGSAFFSAGTGIETAPSSGWDFTTSDFTIEFWTYFIGFDSSGFTTFIKTGDTTAANSIWQIDLKTSTNNLRFIPYVSNSSVVYESSWTPSTNTWYHVAATKSGTSIRMFVDGTQIGSTHTFSQTWDSETVGLSIGKRAIGSFERDFNGYLSNMRIIKGTALYTANFTPPTARLEKTSDTVFLAFQSPGDVLKEETGKILYPSSDGEASAPAVASRFAPDVGEDYGTTFEDNLKFDTLSYMVPPGGTTTQVSRGRGLMMGGGGSPGSQWSGHTNIIDYVEIMSTGNAIDFGDLTNKPYLGNNGCCSSSTRGIQAGGFAPGSTNVINYMTIASPGDAADFGDLSNMKSGTASLSSQTRGIFAGGDPTGGAYVNSIDYITIATTGNSATFGDLVGAATRYATGTASPTRGIIAGGAAPAAINTIEYVTIASTGNATDFGDMSYTGINPFSVSGEGRAIIAGSATEPNQNYNTMNYIIISSTGNGTDFADMNVGKGIGASMSNKVRGLFGRGEYNTQSRYYTNGIDQITISSNGNATDFGDSVSSTTSSGGSSDSHGGIS